MDPLSFTLGLCQTLVGLLCIGLSIPLLHDKIKPNPFYGVRLRQSLQSDAAWFAINRYWAKRMIGWAGFLVILGSASFVVPFARHIWAVWIVVAVIFIAVLVPALQSWTYARREWAVPRV